MGLRQRVSNIENFLGKKRHHLEFQSASWKEDLRGEVDKILTECISYAGSSQGRPESRAASIFVEEIERINDVERLVNGFEEKLDTLIKHLGLKFRPGKSKKVPPCMEKSK